MTNNKYPIFQFEEQQFIPEEQKIEQIKEILNKFLQPIPDNFTKIELEEGNYCGSTNPKWKNKPLSEKYFFTYKGKEYQIDIPHDLMEKLELEKGEDITQPLYLDPKVLVRLETYRGITIKEGEIFLQKPFTIQNLEQNLTKLFEKIEKLEEEEKSNQKTIINLKKELAEKEENRSDWKNVYHQKTQNLQNQLNQVQNERDDYQNKWDNSLEGLEQKEEIIRSYLQQLNLKDARIDELEREKEQELTQKNNEIVRLENETRNLKAERDARPNINLHEWNNDYSRRPTQQQLNSLQQQNSNLRTELNDTKVKLSGMKMGRDVWKETYEQRVRTCEQEHMNKQ